MAPDAPLRTKVIINPQAGSGQTGERWPSIQSALQQAIGAFDTSWTSAPGEAISMTRAALRDAYERIVAVGGDGTLNECINGFLADDRPVRPQSVLAYVASGTGEDFRRTLEISHSPHRAATALSDHRMREIDVGKATYQTMNGATESRYFVNMATLGLGGAVVRALPSARPTWLGSGTLSYLVAILRTLMSHSNQRLTIHVDDERLQTASCHVSIANGRFLAGGIPFAPDASTNDGQFDVVVLGDFSRLGLLCRAHRFYAGTHDELDAVDLLKGQSIRVTSSAASPFYLEADGELLGRLPATFEILPRTLRLQY